MEILALILAICALALAFIAYKKATATPSISVLKKENKYILIDKHNNEILTITKP